MNTPASYHPAGARSGFSILELLVAATISIMIIGLLLTVSGEMLGDYDLIQGRTRVEADADFALDLVASDLMTLTIPRKGEGLRAIADTTGVGDATPQWLVLLGGTYDKDTNHPRATRAVSYRLAYQNAVDGSSSNNVYGLYRAVLDATNTFQVIGTNNLSGAITNSRVPQNFLIGNVAAFQVRFLTANRTWTDPTFAISIDQDSAKTNGVAVPGGFLRAEVMVTVLTPKGAKMVSDGAMTFSNAILRYGRGYSRQVSMLPGAAK